MTAKKVAIRTDCFKCVQGKITTQNKHAANWSVFVLLVPHFQPDIYEIEKQNARHDKRGHHIYQHLCIQDDYEHLERD